MDHTPYCELNSCSVSEKKVPLFIENKLYLPPPKYPTRTLFTFT